MQNWALQAGLDVRWRILKPDLCQKPQAACGIFLSMFFVDLFMAYFEVAQAWPDDMKIRYVYWLIDCSARH